MVLSFAYSCHLFRKRVQDRTYLEEERLGQTRQTTMAERYAISKDSVAEGAAVPESVKLKLARNAALAEEKLAAAAAKKKERAEVRHALKMRSLKYDKES